MQITIALQSGEEVTLKPIRSDVDQQDGAIYRLVPLEGGKEYLTVKLEENRLAIVQRDPEVIEGDALLHSKLDELALDLIESLQSGTEDNEGAVFQEKPYNPELIRVDTKTFSLRQIHDMIENGDIDLSPDFQRNFVWDNTRKSQLIESILLRIPLPMFYFSQDLDGRIIVVDGLQRLGTIRDFMKNDLRLKGLEYLTNCEGKYYTGDAGDALEPKYVRWFSMTQIVVNVIDPQSPASVKYDIFRRINTGGKPLNAQEIRNCLASPNLRASLREMASLPSFVSATLGSVKDMRMDAQELALRFICFHRLNEADPTLDNYSGKIEAVLDSLVDELSKANKTELERYVELYDRSMQNAHHLFGRYAFRKCKLNHLEQGARTQLINKALLVSWSVILSQFDPAKIKRTNQEGILVEPLAEKITEDNDFFQYLTYSTNSKVNIQAAFKAAQELVKRHLSV